MRARMGDCRLQTSIGKTGAIARPLIVPYTNCTVLLVVKL